MICKSRKRGRPQGGQSHKRPAGQQCVERPVRQWPLDCAFHTMPLDGSARAAMRTLLRLSADWSVGPLRTFGERQCSASGVQTHIRESIPFIINAHSMELFSNTTTRYYTSLIDKFTCLKSRRIVDKQLYEKILVERWYRCKSKQ